MASSQTLEQLSEGFHEFCEPLGSYCLNILQQKDHWYCSIYAEKKTSQTIGQNSKQVTAVDSSQMGLVLRIHDGNVLHERAVSAVLVASKVALHKLCKEFATSVFEQHLLPQFEVGPASWEERLRQPGLHNDLLNQVPHNRLPHARVHFSSTVSQHPGDISGPDFCQQRASGIKAAAADQKQDLDYYSVRLQRGKEESYFVDQEVCLSQALLRNETLAIALKSGIRTTLRAGGIGDASSLDFGKPSEQAFDQMIQHLTALQAHERLSPGSYKVIFGPSVSGVLAHEAFGHSQEGDTWAKDRSRARRLWEQKVGVGNGHATILNNPAIYSTAGKPYSAWGSYYFDEEGWLASKQVLLRNGYLEGPMTNLTSHLRLRQPRSANGKRERFDHGVYVRQTNTYFSEGTATFDQLLHQMQDGFLALDPAGGMEDPKGMNIQVGLSFLHEVKAGKLTGRVFKGPSGGDIQMTGFTPQVLQTIVNKSRIFAHDPSQPDPEHPFIDPGGCGKYHKEAVHAGCGGTYLFLDGVCLG